ncbi:MAG: ABC transporter permease [Gemmatimonadales bacterium]
MSLQTWLALLGAVVVSRWAVHALRQRAAQGRRADIWRRFFRHPTAAWGTGLLLFLIVVAVFAPLIAPFDPRAQPDPVALRNHPPTWRFILGNDLYSRDVWSRLVYGARITLFVGGLGALVAVTVGSAVGAVAGYYRRWVDGVLMRGVDIGLALPRIFILLMVIALWERISLMVLVLTIGLTSWFGTSRFVRAEVLALRDRDFVAAARALGVPPARLIFGHILPNAAAPILVAAALGVGNVLLLEAGLSFLGIGVAPPAPSWGNMIADGAPYLLDAPWTTLVPGLAIAAVVMALNAVADALRDALDPREDTA